MQQQQQLVLDNVTSWTRDWCMTINKDKLAATLFSLSTKQEAGNLNLVDTPLQYEDQRTYLGVMFDKKQTWKLQVEKAKAKA